MLTTHPAELFISTEPKQGSYISEKHGSTYEQYPRNKSFSYTTHPRPTRQPAFDGQSDRSALQGVIVGEIYDKKKQYQKKSNINFEKNQENPLKTHRFNTNENLKKEEEEEEEEEGEKGEKGEKEKTYSTKFLIRTPRYAEAPQKKNHGLTTAAHYSKYSSNGKSHHYSSHYSSSSYYPRMSGFVAPTEGGIKKRTHKGGEHIYAKKKYYDLRIPHQKPSPGYGFRFDRKEPQSGSDHGGKATITSEQSPNHPDFAMTSDLRLDHGGKTTVMSRFCPDHREENGLLTNEKEFYFSHNDRENYHHYPYHHHHHHHHHRHHCYSSDRDTNQYKRNNQSMGGKSKGMDFSSRIDNPNLLDRYDYSKHGPRSGPASLREDGSTQHFSSNYIRKNDLDLSDEKKYAEFNVPLGYQTNRVDNSSETTKSNRSVIGGESPTNPARTSKTHSSQNYKRPYHVHDSQYKLHESRGHLDDDRPSSRNRQQESSSQQRRYDYNDFPARSRYDDRDSNNYYPRNRNSNNNFPGWNPLRKDAEIKGSVVFQSGNHNGEAPMKSGQSSDDPREVRTSWQSHDHSTKKIKISPTKEPNHHNPRISNPSCYPLMNGQSTRLSSELSVFEDKTSTNNYNVDLKGEPVTTNSIIRIQKESKDRFSNEDTAIYSGTIEKEPGNEPTKEDNNNNNLSINISKELANEFMDNDNTIKKVLNNQQHFFKEVPILSGDTDNDDNINDDNEVEIIDIKEHDKLPKQDQNKDCPYRNNFHNNKEEKEEKKEEEEEQEEERKEVKEEKAYGEQEQEQEQGQERGQEEGREEEEKEEEIIIDESLYMDTEFYLLTTKVPKKKNNDNYSFITKKYSTKKEEEEEEEEFEEKEEEKEQHTSMED
jgi:hypothetical protein